MTKLSNSSRVVLVLLLCGTATLFTIGTRYFFLETDPLLPDPEPQALADVLLIDTYPSNIQEAVHRSFEDPGGALEELAQLRKVPPRKVVVPTQIPDQEESESAPPAEEGSEEGAEETVQMPAAAVNMLIQEMQSLQMQLMAQDMAAQGMPIPEEMLPNPEQRMFLPPNTTIIPAVPHEDEVIPDQPTESDSSVSDSSGKEDNF